MLSKISFPSLQFIDVKALSTKNFCKKLFNSLSVLDFPTIELKKSFCVKFMNDLISRFFLQIFFFRFLRWHFCSREKHTLWENFSFELWHRKSNFSTFKNFFLSHLQCRVDFVNIFAGTFVATRAFHFLPLCCDKRVLSLNRVNLFQNFTIASQ